MNGGICNILFLRSYLMYSYKLLFIRKLKKKHILDLYYRDLDDYVEK